MERMILDWCWERGIRPLLFCLEEEWAHEKAVTGFGTMMKVPGMRALTEAALSIRDYRLGVRRFGIDFENPVGLAAGLDKNGTWARELMALGFGFIEVGSVTASEQPGNVKPRMFRLAKDQAILNRMGCNNRGAEKVAEWLASRKVDGVLGINICKSAMVKNEDAADDYMQSLDYLYPCGSYFVLNLSSPNTPGLRDLHEKEALREIVLKVQGRMEELARVWHGKIKPVLVKLSPDLEEGQLDAVLEVCMELNVAGVIVANSTVSRDWLTTGPEELERCGMGGISGSPLTLRTRAMVKKVFAKVGKGLAIVGVGGVMSGEDAWELIRAGASLVQVLTGLVYKGPGLVAEINRTIRDRLKDRGLVSIDEVIGEAK